MNHIKRKPILILLILQFVVSLLLFTTLTGLFAKFNFHFTILLVTTIWFLFSTVTMVVGVWMCSTYLCPNCNNIVKPGFWKWAGAFHSFTVRRLYCPTCKSKQWCKHTFFIKDKNNQNTDSLNNSKEN